MSAISAQVTLGAKATSVMNSPKPTDTRARSLGVGRERCATKSPPKMARSHGAHQQPVLRAVFWWNVVWASKGRVTVKLKANVPTTATARITFRSNGVLNTYLRPRRSCPFSRTTSSSHELAGAHQHSASSTAR